MTTSRTGNGIIRLMGCRALRTWMRAIPIMEVAWTILGTMDCTSVRVSFYSFGTSEHI
jgi:hypothetical protein